MISGTRECGKVADVQLVANDRRSRSGATISVCPAHAGAAKALLKLVGVSVHEQGALPGTICIHLVEVE